MFPLIKLINMLPHYFPVKKKYIVGAHSDLYAQVTTSPNIVWFYARGKNCKSGHPLFSPVLFSIVSKPTVIISTHERQ